ncbi:MAG TPA: hypothetical protein GXX17_03745 [Clostridiales bacterium]|nr:hypothetical protein [Clostridiales bacterium]
MKELPLGFSLTLAQNQAAMEYFSSLPDSKKQEIINQTRNISSKNEMHEFVANLAKQNQKYN